MTEAPSRLGEPWYPVETERLILRGYRPEDRDDIHAYAADPEVTRLVPWGPNQPEATQTFLAEMIEEQACWPPPECTLGLELKAGGHLIGGIGIRIHDPWNRTADFGYVLHRDYWGRGYMTEAARALLKVAFEVLGLHRVWATCDVRNTGSWRVMEKLGMRREATQLRDVLQKGEWRTSYRYAILEDEWAGLDCYSGTECRQSR